MSKRTDLYENFEESKRITTAKTITINKELIKTIEDLAVKENRNFSNMVETLLLRQLKTINQ